jgi:hypothetical protein
MDRNTIRYGSPTGTRELVKIAGCRGQCAGGHADKRHAADRRGAVALTDKRRTDELVAARRTPSTPRRPPRAQIMTDIYVYESGGSRAPAAFLAGRLKSIEADGAVLRPTCAWNRVRVELRQAGRKSISGGSNGFSGAAISRSPSAGGQPSAAGAATAASCSYSHRNDDMMAVEHPQRPSVPLTAGAPHKLYQTCRSTNPSDNQCFLAVRRRLRTVQKVPAQRARIAPSAVFSAGTRRLGCGRPARRAAIV